MGGAIIRPRHAQNDDIAYRQVNGAEDNPVPIHRPRRYHSDSDFPRVSQTYSSGCLWLSHLFGQLAWH